MKLQQVKSPDSNKQLGLTAKEIDKIGSRYLQLKQDVKDDSAALSEIAEWVKQKTQSIEQRGKIRAMTGDNYVVGVMCKTHRSIDVQKLRDRIPTEVWKSIRRITVQIDEAALAEAVASGKISAKLLKKCITETPMSPQIYIRAKKGGHENSE